MPILNISKNSVRLKPNVDLSKYERLFALDESLKPVSTILLWILQSKIIFLKKNSGTGTGTKLDQGRRPKNFG